MRAFSIGLPVALVVAAALAGCGGDQPAAAPNEQGAAQEQAAPPPPPARKTLPNAEPAGPAALALDSLVKVDLAGKLASGELSLAASDDRFQTSIMVLVDGDPQTMTISNGTNPIELTVTLDAPIKLRAARVYLVASSYDWVIEPAPGVGRRLAAAVPERTWSQIDLPEAVETSVVRFELLRLERDDFVHAGEIELYAEP